MYGSMEESTPAAAPALGPAESVVIAQISLSRPPPPTNCAAAITGACLEGGDSDNDCCAPCGEGGCAPGYTYAGQFTLDEKARSSRYPDFYPYCRELDFPNLCGNTCCVPSNGTAQAMAGE